MHELAHRGVWVAQHVSDVAKVRLAPSDPRERAEPDVYTHILWLFCLLACRWSFAVCPPSVAVQWVRANPLSIYLSIYLSI
jgi:hypothetical protein